MSKDTISAFAFRTGKAIEEVINEETNNLRDKNQLLEAKILQWYANKGQDPEFAEFFGIGGTRKGKIE